MLSNEHRQGSGTTQFKRTIRRIVMWIVAVLLFPVLPVMALPGATTPPAGDPPGNNGQDPPPEGDDSGDDEEEDDEEEEGDNKDWDPERAMRTIRNLRQSEKDLKKTLKEAQASLKKFQDAEDEQRRNALSETDKVKEDLTKEQEARQAAESELQEYKLERAFRRAIAKAGVAFVNPQAEMDAFDLALPELADVDLDDKPDKAIGKILEGLKESRPYLFADGKDKGPGTPPRGAAARRPPTTPTQQPPATEPEPPLINF
jgi:hypothetical protein